MPSARFLKRHAGFAGVYLAMIAPHVSSNERQLTQAPHGHVLTNVNVWSPDGRWIVYDTRGTDSIFDGTRIEQVNVQTGEVQRLYESKNGATCGVVTYHPREAKVVFIHGPENPTAEWSYGASRRRGVVVDSTRPGEARPLDAMNYAPPFTAGALRGGSHVHVFSSDGAWVSFTYEDEVLARLGASPDRGSAHDWNQRNVGVAIPAPNRRPVQVARNHPRNHDGDYFSVLVTRTVNRPRPGSDEISKAYEEGWIVDPDGQPSIAFLGNVTAPDGREHAELFVVDLPSDLSLEGDAPLEGSATRRPAPPCGVTQRRITFTADRAFRGVVTNPRHWVRSSPDGKRLAFLMRDDAGIVQLWTISPAGGEARQLTHGPENVSSAFTWSPDGQRIAHTMDGSVCATDIATGRTERLTSRRTEVDSPEPLACVFSPDGRHIAFTRRVASAGGTFAQVFIVPIPSP